MRKCPPQEEKDDSLPPLSLTLVSSGLNRDEKENYDLREYTLKVDYRNREYRVTKRINLFLTLYDNLEDHFPSLKMPEVPDLFITYPDDRSALKQEGIYANDYTDALILLLQFFCK